ncbi:MAG: DNA double-strand break repair nuclease NurA [Pyrinomonadaceae bacterium]
MLFRQKLHNELTLKNADFQLHLLEQSRELEFYLSTLAELEKTPFAEIDRRFANTENIGAIPATELESNGSFSFPFANSWQNHQQARAWALDTLANRTTFAADGSQLYVEKETSLPIGAIQIGWFENPHNAEQSYEKNAEFRILSPRELLENQDEPINPETRVGEERFHAEAAKVGEFLTRKSGWRQRGEKMPLAFFDGTLLVSFSLPQTKIQTSFVKAMADLVLHSREMQVPMLGYIDRSFARDLISMLCSFREEPVGNRTLFDASILHRRVPGFQTVTKLWGDRTCFCYSKRSGLNAFLDSETGKPLVGFSYLQTTSDSSPARLDIPAWIYEEALLDELLDVVRAECVIGLGYPYALETADQTAVISIRDREVFFRALQEFATREKLDFSVTRKGASKGRRR